MNWYDFADKDDIRARDPYQDLLVARMNAGMDPYSGFVKVPRKVLHHLSRGIHSEDHSILWTGFEWVNVIDYEGSNGRVYIRLPLSGEQGS